MVDKDDKKWNRTLTTIYNTENFIEDLSDLQNDLEKELSGDFTKLTIDTMNFLHEIPDKETKKEKKYV